MYRIYGKKKTDKRFKPYDSTNGKLTTNLIHATLYTDDQLPGLKEEVSHMNTLNPGHTFKIKKSNGAY